MRRAVGLIALVALLALPAAAQAHATLESTSPSRGAKLAKAPAQVEFRFDESVDASLGAVRVFDARGHEVQSGTAFHPGGTGSRVAVHLRSGLGDGGYTATYRVVSADSHPVSGGVTFTVGDGAAGTASVADLLRGQTSGPVTGTAFSIVRSVEYAAIALGLGTAVFLLACWLPALELAAGAGAGWAAASATFATRARLLLGIAALAGIGAGVLAILLQAAEGEGSSLWSSTGAAGDVLATRFGAAWMGAIVVWLLVGAAVTAGGSTVPVLRPSSVGATGLALGRPGVPLRTITVLLGGLCLLPALAGHPSVQPPVWLLAPANVVHVAAMAAWLGGVAVLVLGLRAATGRLDPEERAPLLAAVVGRFSALAGVAVAALFVTGAVQGIVEVRRVGALFDTAFGRAVLIKLLLFGALVTLGWINRSRLLPALRESADSARRAGVLLRRTLRAELLVGVAVLAVTGALAGYPPSTAVATGPVTRDAVVGPAHLELTVDPATVGPNALHLYLFDHHTGGQFTRAKEIAVTAALPAKGIAPLPLDVRTAGPGHAIGSGTLGVAGDWRLTVTVRVSAFDEYVAHLTVPIR